MNARCATVDRHFLFPINLVVDSRERLYMPRAKSYWLVARERCGEAFSGNGVAYKYRVNMQV
jgi:hypothetical protein